MKINRKPNLGFITTIKKYFPITGLKIAVLKPE